MNTKYIHNLKKKIGKTIVQQGLISPEDKILIALSGGKDSMILLEALAHTQKVVPFKFDLASAHVFIENIGYKTDTDYLRTFSESHGVKFYLEKFQISLSKETKKPICFVCSWNRRKSLFALTKNLGYNKLAFGHHMDDALQTLFMNMIYRGSISSLPFKFTMFGGRLEVIRPLLEIQESALVKYSEIQDYKPNIKSCSFEDTKRKEMNDILDLMNSKYRVASKNIFRSLDNIYPEYLPRWKNEL
ncbi:MAG: tRNA 2-thiocytidine(32) synthetase TtcA [Bacteroidales bacterium]|nr:tRNA 2-thiocytidine(32) synthetase TtcA [Bacteroidales bacterium]MBN2819686.1 tRNA 2-thiocytidine(32) synthetase TtcA [Bacteroidales bacterium]